MIFKMKIGVVDYEISLLLDRKRTSEQVFGKRKISEVHHFH